MLCGLTIKLNEKLFKQTYNALTTLSNNVCRTHSFNAINDNNVNNNANQLNNDESKPSWVSFAMAKHGSFYQDIPRIENQFTCDAFLNRYLRKVLPQQMYYGIKEDLTRFGLEVATKINEIGRDCDIHLPKLVPQNAWGQQCNDLYVCEAWKRQKDISAREGIVAIGYERKYEEWSRLYQFSKLYLYAPSSGLYSCPIAMTDGAARTIESLMLTNNPLYAQAFKRLTSRDPKLFWTSGQWMTEKGGGSDVASGTETVAIPFKEDIFKLYGYKWFSSATDADIALTLARITDTNGNVTQGSRGLTLFYLKLRDDENCLNNINMIRLKDKLGTRQVPTAELLLDGVLAYKMSEEGRGVAAISNMLQITRIHNAIGSAAYMRRILSIARDYSHRRVTFGKPICYHPLHIQTLARIDLESKGAFMLAFENARLLGRQEIGCASDEDILLLRLLNPLSKLFVCKQSMSTISEGLEAFGGQGAMEDTGLPVMLRDSQIFVIWEGTTNILSLDVLRCLSKTEGQAILAFRSNINNRLKIAEQHNQLKDEASRVKLLINEIINIVQTNSAILNSGARDFAFSLAKLFIAASLMEFSCGSDSTQLDVETALRWCRTQDISPFLTNYRLNYYDENASQLDYKLVMEAYNERDPVITV